MPSALALMTFITPDLSGNH